MMLFLHLFNNQERVALCEPLLQLWSGRSLPYALSKVAAWCVPIYIFLSGYGLAAKYSQSQLSMPAAIRRLLPLCVNYWVVFIPFILLGSLFRPDLYPGDGETLFLNLVGFSCSYNAEWWFLLPYMVLAWMSPIIFRHLFFNPGGDSRHTVKCTATAVLLYVLSDVSYKHYASTFDEEWFLTLLQNVCQLYLMFFCGAMFFWHDCFQRFNIFLRSRVGHHTRWVSAILLLLLCLVRMSMDTYIINPLFVLPSLLFYSVLQPSRPSSVLLSLGRQSTTMWLCHTFFAYYLFSDFIYSFRYPPLIFLVLVTVSWAVSFPLTRLSTYLSSHLMYKM